MVLSFAHVSLRKHVVDIDPLKLKFFLSIGLSSHSVVDPWCMCFVIQSNAIPSVADYFRGTPHESWESKSKFLYFW